MASSATGLHGHPAQSRVVLAWRIEHDGVMRLNHSLEGNHAQSRQWVQVRRALSAIWRRAQVWSAKFQFIKFSKSIICWFHECSFLPWSWHLKNTSLVSKGRRFFSFVPFNCIAQCNMLIFMALAHGIYLCYLRMRVYSFSVKLITKVKSKKNVESQ